MAQPNNSRENYDNKNAYPSEFSSPLAVLPSPKEPFFTELTNMIIHVIWSNKISKKTTEYTSSGS